MSLNLLPGAVLGLDYSLPLHLFDCLENQIDHAKKMRGQVLGQKVKLLPDSVVKLVLLFMQDSVLGTWYSVFPRLREVRGPFDLPLGEEL